MSEDAPNVNAHDFRSVEDLAQGPHKRAIDSHQLQPLQDISPLGKTSPRFSLEAITVFRKNRHVTASLHNKPKSSGKNEIP
jgi:hypothetical protein